MKITNCFFLKIWHRKNRYRQVRHRNSLPKIWFPGVYDAPPLRNFEFCVFDLALRQKTTSASWLRLWWEGERWGGRGTVTQITVKSIKERSLTEELKISFYISSSLFFLVSFFSCPAFFRTWTSFRYILLRKKIAYILGFRSKPALRPHPWGSFGCWG